MEGFAAVFTNQTLLVAIAACLLAQGTKLIIALVRLRQFQISALFSAGGMPSAHSALVAALATSVGQTKGWSSPEFAIACMFAVIVMYDAAGVRQAAGKQAKVLNQIVDELFQEGEELSSERLKELLGHTPLQVLAGLCLGIAIALIVGARVGG
ncbi:MAG: divergent PAP2 family protein [Cyanobacteria bacterium P01_G01_bin.54]